MRRNLLILIFVSGYLLVGCQLGDNRISGRVRTPPPATPDPPDAGPYAVTTMYSLPTTDLRIGTFNYSPSGNSTYLEVDSSVHGLIDILFFNPATGHIQNVPWDRPVFAQSPQIRYMEDGQRILVQMGDDIFVYNYITNQLSYLFSHWANIVNSGDFAISPNGHFFTFAYPGYGVWVVPLNGDPMVRVDDDSLLWVVSQLEFSPDSSKVAFIGRVVGGGDKLYIADVDGNNEIELSGPMPGTSSHITSFKFTPDSSKVVYFGEQDFDNVNELYVIGVDGNNRVQLNPNLGGTSKDVVNNFEIAPNGTFVAYISSEQTAGQFELFAIDIDGLNPRKLSVLSPHVNGDVMTGLDAIRISADSSRVYYIGDLTTDGVKDVYFATADGLSRVNITNFSSGIGAVYNVEFSSDGSYVYYRANEGVFNQLYSATANGAGHTAIGGSVVSGGQVLNTWGTNNSGSHVIFRGDLDVDNVNEYYSAPLAGGARTKISPLPQMNFSGLATSSDRVFLSGASGCHSVAVTGGSQIDYNNLNIGEFVHTCRYLTALDRVLVLAGGVYSRRFQVWTVGGNLEFDTPLPGQANFQSGFAKHSSTAGKIVYADESDLFSASSDGTSPIKINQFDLESNSQSLFYKFSDRPSDLFQLAPAQDRVLYVGKTGTGEDNLYSVKLDGSDHVHISTGLIPGSKIVSFIISPDGLKVAYLVDRYMNVKNYGDGIFVANIDGTNLQEMTLDTPNPARYVWLDDDHTNYAFTPDSNKVVYIARHDWCCAGAASEENVYSTHVDGSNHRLLGQYVSSPTSQFLIASDSDTVVYRQGGIQYAASIATGATAPLGANSTVSNPLFLPESLEFVGAYNGNIYRVPTSGADAVALHSEEPISTSTTTFKSLLSPGGEYFIYSAPILPALSGYRVFSYSLGGQSNHTLSPLFETTPYLLPLSGDTHVLIAGQLFGTNDYVLAIATLDGSEFTVIDDVGPIVITEPFKIEASNTFLAYPISNNNNTRIDLKISSLDGLKKEKITDSGLLHGFKIIDDSTIHFIESKSETSNLNEVKKLVLKTFP
ncbi:MAG: hypothetical protein H6626_13690 [Pseudobdellovibrionaceae bacterium]|nr:MAG: hypothetical protein H6626_13690 [Pseudobdellovibrionaceae bacterium]